MLFLWIHFSLMMPPNQKVERRKTSRVVEGAEGVLSVVVVDEVVAVVEEDEDSRGMAYFRLKSVYPSVSVCLQNPSFFFFSPHRNRRMFRNFDIIRGMIFGRKQCMNYNHRVIIVHWKFTDWLCRKWCTPSEIVEQFINKTCYAECWSERLQFNLASLVFLSFLCFRVIVYFKN